MSDPSDLPLGTWPPPFTTGRVARGAVSLAETHAEGDSTTWLQAELTFYGRVLGFEAADELQPLEIRHLP